MHAGRLVAQYHTIILQDLELFYRLYTVVLKTFHMSLGQFLKTVTI